MSGLEGEIQRGKESILTCMHSRHLGNIPFAHVAAELFGVVEHCKERRGKCQDWKVTRRRGKE